MQTPEPLAVLLVAHHLCVIFPLAFSSALVQTISSLLEMNTQHLVLSTAAILDSLLLLARLAKLYPQLRIIEADAGERMLIASWWVVSAHKQKRWLEESSLVREVFQEVSGGVREAGEELCTLISQEESYRAKNTARRVHFSRKQNQPSIERSSSTSSSASRSLKRASPPNFCRPLYKFVDSDEERQQDIVVHPVVQDELFHAL